MVGKEVKIMKIKNIKQKILYLGAIGVSVFLLFFVVTVSWIGFDVKSQCQDAEREYEKDCVESLTMLLADEGKGLKQRNSAIWVLGQMGDIRALPTLEKYYTGNIPDRESLYKTISQYELKKAIELVKGGTNITAIFWRGI